MRISREQSIYIKDLYKCAQVSKKFRHISHDKSFWKCINLSNQSVSCEFITQIIKLGTEYLNLQGAFLMDDVDTDLPRENNLKYLNLAESSVDDRFLVRLLRSSKSLEKLSLTGVNTKYFIGKHEQKYLVLEYATSWYVECLLPNAKMLTTLDLSRKQIEDFNGFQHFDIGSIRFESIREIIIPLIFITDKNLSNLLYSIALMS